MPEEIFTDPTPEALTEPTTEPTKYLCRHILTDGHRCQSPALREQDFCYFHQAARVPATRIRRKVRAKLNLPLPEDRAAIQFSIGEVLHRIANETIDPRRAGLLLYGLQIASHNLPRRPASKTEPNPGDLVDEFTQHPTLGPVAPRTEVIKPVKEKSLAQRLIEEMRRQHEEDALNPPPHNWTNDPLSPEQLEQNEEFDTD